MGRPMIGLRGPVTIVLVLLLAGCNGPDPEATAVLTSASVPSAEPARFDETTGGIDGIIADDEAYPIPFANVTLVPIGQTITDPDGRFSFSNVPPGKYTVHATRPGFYPAAREETVVAGEAVLTTLILMRLPSTDPYHQTLPVSGKVDARWASTIRRSCAQRQTGVMLSTK
jgi:hypothetical protein